MYHFMKFFVLCITCLIVFALSFGFTTVYAQVLQFDPDTIVTGHTSIISCIGCVDPTVQLFRGGASTPITLTLVSGSNPPVFLSSPISFPDPAGTIITVTTIGANATTTIQQNFASLLDFSPNYNKTKKQIPILTTTCSSSNQFTGGDLDGDLICDNWENQVGYPAACPSTGLCIRTSATSPVYFLGCNPNHNLATNWSDKCPQQNRTDIYYELDFLTGHRPKLSAISDVSIAFDTSGYIPNTNSGVLPGVNLHVQLDEPLPHVNVLSPTGSGPSPGFDQIKYWHFGTPLERLGYQVATNNEPGPWGTPNVNNENMRNVKAQVFHYMVFGHNLPSCNAANRTCSTGHAESPGNDAFVTLGSFDNMIGTLDQQEGTLMHEIGHDLQLLHGGNTTENCIPNYLSVMSYSRQFSDLVNRPLGYSKNTSLQVILEGTLPPKIGSYYPEPEQQIVFSTPPLASPGIGYWLTGSTPDIQWGTNAFNVNKFPGICDDPEPPTDTLRSFWDLDPSRLRTTARTTGVNWQD